jgi:hypothetical protein
MVFPQICEKCPNYFMIYYTKLLMEIEYWVVFSDRQARTLYVKHVVCCKTLAIIFKFRL